MRTDYGSEVYKNDRMVMEWNYDVVSASGSIFQGLGIWTTKRRYGDKRI